MVMLMLYMHWWIGFGGIDDLLGITHGWIGMLESVEVVGIRGIGVSLDAPFL